MIQKNIIYLAGEGLTLDPMRKICKLLHLEKSFICQTSIIQAWWHDDPLPNVILEQSTYHKSRMAATLDLSLTLDHMGKTWLVNCYILKTVSYIEPILIRHGNMMVLYKIYDFSTDHKSKMATMAGLSFTLDLMGKTCKLLHLEKYSIYETSSQVSDTGSCKPLVIMAANLPKNVGGFDTCEGPLGVWEPLMILQIISYLIIIIIMLPQTKSELLFFIRFFVIIILSSDEFCLAIFLQMPQQN